MKFYLGQPRRDWLGWMQTGCCPCNTEGWKEGGEQDRNICDGTEAKPIYLLTEQTFMMCLLFVKCLALGRHNQDLALDLRGCRIA